MFSPGQYLSTSDITRQGASESSRVELIPITPKLIAMERATHQRATLPAQLLTPPAEYRIGNNDVLYITVWDHPELTAPSGAQQQIDANGRLVRSDGTLYYPYVGEVQAAGKTIQQLRSDIASKLSAFIADPQVDVAVLRFASQKVVVSGAVSKAGPQSISTNPLSVVEALGSAGIDPLNADLSGLLLTRSGQVYPLNLDALNHQDSELQNVYLKGGDQLYLPYNDNKRIYVMGEVNQPRALTFKTSTMNLSDVLGSVGGLSQTTSNGNAVYVIRGVENLDVEPAKIYQLQAESPTAMALATHFDVRPQDIVYVGPANVTRWNRFISQLVPSAAILGVGASAAKNLNDANSDK
ncbi:capsular biosynthesis protein [Pseudomonas sp. CCM 7891]|uniref:Capsular biosynthesis protein n=2 Tax=Pseudomonas karstica TaxID=1055468 RepID=A0A7X2RVR6_9PSED|nr:polysaccharide biosynthesis/export family protein [Pseudomonas karstica]MTD21916.1 capsular biosynthesis protein [Pseudomonas karstica]